MSTHPKNLTNEELRLAIALLDTRGNRARMSDRDSQRLGELLIERAARAVRVRHAALGLTPPTPHPPTMYAIERVDRSPMNAKVWCAQLACGHEYFTTARKPRIGAMRRCEKCETKSDV